WLPTTMSPNGRLMSALWWRPPPGRYPGWSSPATSEAAMDFPITDLLDEGACYAWLSGQIHPRGLRCPRCGDREMGVHRRRRAPGLDYRCKGCGAVFNVFTGTALAGTRMKPSVLVLVLRGFAQGVTTARLARELGLNRPHLLALRHKLQAHALDGADRSPLPDGHVEGDEVYQTAGENRGAAPRPRRPPQAAGRGGPGAGDLGQRPAAGAGGRGPHVGAAAAAGGGR